MPTDWWAPPVDSLLDAIVAEDGLAQPCAELARARAKAGVGLPEAFDDLWALFSVLRRLPPPNVVRRFAESYAESAPAAELVTESVDPLTGIARLEYLRVRLGEVYREAAALSREVPATHGLLTVRFEALPTGWLGTTCRLAIARVLHTTFCSGETIATVGPSALAVLTLHATTVVPADLSATLSDTSGTDVLVRRIRLPTTLPGALMQLDVLAESDCPETPHK
ncbi:MAG: hypothetical protein GEV07_04855 [Streptosporangiales bacterium]|nr:hypothetical protein [Streptosporangiales bacterium]